MYIYRADLGGRPSADPKGPLFYYFETMIFGDGL